jgi:hypothetical protein
MQYSVVNALFGVVHAIFGTKDEIGWKRSKICIIISYNIFLLGNDTLENDTDNENRYIGNETIRSKICRYRSITVPQIENIQTMNGYICNMFTTK